MWIRMSLWTLYRRQNVWWFGSARSALWIFSGKYFEGSFTEEVTVEVKDIFEGGLKISEYEAKKKFIRIASADQGAIGEQSGIDRGVSD